MLRRSTRRSGILSVIFAIFPLIAGTAPACNDARLVPLNRTVPVGIITGTTAEQQEKAIEYGLAQRHWAVVQKTPGRYVAQLNDHAVRVVVNVDYGEQGIVVTYVESSELRYTKTEDGRELIHRRYASWIRGLVGDIRNALQNGYSNPPPPSPAPPPVTVMVGPEGNRDDHQPAATSVRTLAAAARTTSPGGG